MSPEDMFSTDPAKNEWTDEQILSMWPQAKGELGGFAYALARGGSGITAAQLRMAVVLADEAYSARSKQA